MNDNHIFSPVAKQSFARHYPAKVLLFGEHLVLMGSEVLAIPYHRWQAQWSEQPSDYLWWRPFGRYLLDSKFSFLSDTRLQRCLRDLTIEMNIPIGYGLGSSGAITAAFYHYACSLPTDDPRMIQQRLGLMESFFHGNSSGFDPLVSLLDQGLRIDAEGLIHTWQGYRGSSLYCYLLDSGIPREGKDAIRDFRLAANEHPDIFQSMVALNNRIVATMSHIETSTDNVLALIHALSKDQYRHLPFLIAPSILPVWKETLSNDHIAIKICGAGGGGYYLVFTDEPREDLEGLKLVEVPISCS